MREIGGTVLSRHAKWLLRNPRAETDVRVTIEGRSSAGCAQSHATIAHRCWIERLLFESASLGCRSSCLCQDHRRQLSTKLRDAALRNATLPAHTPAVLSLNERGAAAWGVIIFVRMANLCTCRKSALQRRWSTRLVKHRCCSPPRFGGVAPAPTEIDPRSDASEMYSGALPACSSGTICLSRCVPRRKQLTAPRGPTRGWN